MEHGVGVRLAGRLVLLTLLRGNLAQAADPPPAQKPLLWAADAEGGAPYVSMDPDHPGQYVGFEVDLREPSSRNSAGRSSSSSIDFPKLDSGLLRGDFDFAMNGMEATPDRQGRFRLSRPYYVYTLQLVCRRDDNRIHSLDDCKKNGVVVGTLANTAAARLLSQKGIRSHLRRPDHAL